MGPLQRLAMRVIQRVDRLRLARLHRKHPGLEIHPDASTNLVHARIEIAEGGRLRIGAHVTTERRPDGVRFVVEAGAEIVIERDTWLCSELQPVHLRALPGGRIQIGEDAILNGCHISAREEVSAGRRARIGPGVRIWDSNHAIDDQRPEHTAAVRLGDCVWLAADATLLPGADVGSHSVVATRAVVTKPVPAHTLVAGIPASERGAVGDRSEVEV